MLDAYGVYGVRSNYGGQLYLSSRKTVFSGSNEICQAFVKTL